MRELITILVVDDHTLFRRGLISLLGQEDGVKVVGEAADGGDALRIAEALQPDLILLDNHMPGVSGVALLPITAPGAGIVAGAAATRVGSDSTSPSRRASSGFSALCRARSAGGMPTRAATEATVSPLRATAT